MIEKLLGWKKENYLKRFDPKNHKEASTVHFTQLIKGKLLLLSADGDWSAWWGRQTRAVSSGSHFKLRRLDECVWWRVCHSKVCRIKSQSDFPWEGLKITGDKKEKGGTYKIVRQRPATTYEQRHKNVLISQRMKVCRTRYCTMQLCCYASND